MSTDTYDVLINGCYGHFAFPAEFVETVFLRFPPDSHVGSKLFPRAKEPLHLITPAEEPDLEWKKYYVIQGVVPLSGNYQCILADLFVRHGSGFHRFAEAYPFFATADMTTYFYLRDFTAYEWRTNTTVINAAREANIIGNQRGDSLLQIAKVPIHCGFHIVSDIGREEAVIDFPV